VPHAVTPPQSASASPAAAAAFAIIPCIIVMPLPSWPAEAGGLAVPYCLGWTLGKAMQGHHERAPTGSPTSLRGDRPGQVSEGVQMGARCHLHSAVGWPPKMYARDGKRDCRQGRRALRQVPAPSRRAGQRSCRAQAEQYSEWPAPRLHGPRAQRGTGRGIASISGPVYAGCRSFGAAPGLAGGGKV
jgi:hypothetical protein